MEPVRRMASHRGATPPGGKALNSIMLATGMALAAIVSFAAIFAIRRYANALGLLDAPNERSSHRVVTPRGGGLAIILGSVVGATALSWIGDGHSAGWVLFGAAALIGAVGFLDDRHNLSPVLRLSAQIAAAAVVIYSCGPLGALP